MESKSLKTFRRKMANPLNWRKANQLFVKYTVTDLASVDRTKHLIRELASELNVPLSNDEQEQAAKWLVNQKIDPKSRRDRMSIWKKAK